MINWGWSVVNRKVLVHLHLFYHNQLDYMMSKLKNICGCDWDLYVTVCEDNEKSIKKLKAFKPDVHIIKVENLGYDVWPFIQVLRMVDINDYKYVLKLHTKAKYGFPLKTYSWRNALVDSILISKKQFRKVVSLFEEDSSVGFAGRSTYWMLFSGLVPEEQGMLNRMMKRLHLRYAENYYLSGTMFFARMSVFKPVVESDISAEDFSLFSKTASKATNAHVLERVFSFLAPNSGLKNAKLTYFSGRIKEFLKRLCSIEFIWSERQKGIVLFLFKKRFPLKIVKQKCYIPPVGAKDIVQSFDVANVVHNRLVIFAGYCPDGKIKDSQLYYLNGLKNVADNIIFVCDCQILPQEIEKIKDIVQVCIFKHHGGYDFGSYKLGYKYALDKGLLNNVDELIFCNDSCYGPVFPFEKCFDSMKDTKCDFWGVVTNCNPKKRQPEHLQSFFIVIKSNVFNSDAFSRFMCRIKPQRKVKNVIKKYEIPFTNYLKKYGFSYAVFVPDEKFPYGNINKTFYPLTLIRDFEVPLVKVKVFNNIFLDKLREFSNDTLDYIERVNPELAEIIKKENDM